MERIVGGVTTVTVGSGIAASVRDGANPRSTAILCHAGSEAVARRIAGADLAVLVLPDGEDAKRLDAVETAVLWLADEGIHRDGTAIAVGGGSLLDAAGFVASVYLRGIEARFVPTTLLAAVDASIGGKNAVNVGGKNLVGTFTHPSRVVVDMDVIAANPPRLVADGLSECIKAGALADSGLLDDIAAAGIEVELRSVVERAIAVKAAVVDADFTESGIRAHLNLGHTVGHAVEHLAGWSHGRSVAVGLAAAAAASEHAVGFTEADRLLAALRAAGLPTIAPELDRAEVLRLIDRDKKADVGGVRMVLLEAVGRPVVSHVDSATLGAALAAVGIGDR